jgi:hypothetical protein
VLVREGCLQFAVPGGPIVRAGMVFGVFGVVYLAATLAFGVSEARSLARRLRLQRG